MEHALQFTISINPQFTYMGILKTMQTTLESQPYGK